jgi:hypothetical protein
MLAFASICFIAAQVRAEEGVAAGERGHVVRGAGSAVGALPGHALHGPAGIGGVLVEFGQVLGGAAVGRPLIGRIRERVHHHACAVERDAQVRDIESALDPVAAARFGAHDDGDLVGDPDDVGPPGKRRQLVGDRFEGDVGLLDDVLVVHSHGLGLVVVLHGFG